MFLGLETVFADPGSSNGNVMCHVLVYTHGNWTLLSETCADDFKVSAEICFEMPQGRN